MRSFHLAHVGVAAILSAAAVSVFGIAAHVNAAPGDVSSVVPIVPCRLFGRATETVGTRSTPIDEGEEATFAVWGTNGNCTIPSTATEMPPMSPSSTQRATASSRCIRLMRHDRSPRT